MNIKIKVFSSAQLASKYVASCMQKFIAHKPNAVLGLATGSTPELLYAELVKLHNDNELDFCLVRTFNLDEYDDIAPENHQSYHYFMHQHLFSKINIGRSNIFFPNKFDNYDFLIHQTGGIDLQILGIGTNGHIGFNEPGSLVDSVTRIVKLSKNTIKDNARFFTSICDVPTQAISMGLATIMKSKKIYLLAFGKNKKAIVKKLLETKLFSADLPASILHKHADVELVVDQAAWSK